jgi:site-specific DNA-adenine methylase
MPIFFVSGSIFNNFIYTINLDNNFCYTQTDINKLILKNGETIESKNIISIVKTNKLQNAAKILQNTIITSEDYNVLLEKEGENVLIYLDPPYVKNSHLAKQSQLYMHNFGINDHITLCNNVKKCKI